MKKPVNIRKAFISLDKSSRADMVVLLLSNQTADEALARFPEKKRIIGVNKGQFSIVDLLLLTLKKTGPADVIITTWSAGFYDAQVVEALLKSGLIKSIQLITDRSFRSRQKEYAVSIEEAFGIENIRTTDLHAKFLLIKNDNHAVCVRSSMNLNENKRLENFDFDDDEDIYNHFLSIVDDLFDAQEPGFIESRAIVDPVFDSLMGGMPTAVKPKKVPPVTTHFRQAAFKF